MKRSTAKRAMSLLLALVMVVSLLPALTVQAEAATPSVISVGGVAVKAGQYLASGESSATDEKPESGSYAFYTGYTLYLNRFTYTGDALGVGSSGDLSIELVGENTLSTSSNCLYAGGRLLIYGEGTLHGTTTTLPAVYSVGAMTLSGGTLDLRSGSGNVVNARSHLTVLGGTLQASAAGDYAAVSVRGDLAVNGGALCAVNAGSSQALYTAGTLTQTGGTIDTSSASGNAVSCGELSVSGGTLYAEAKGSYPALYSESTMTLSGGTVNARNTGSGDAVQVVGSLTQTGGELEATGVQMGIYAGGSITAAGRLTARSTADSAECYAIACSSFTVGEGWQAMASVLSDGTTGTFDDAALDTYDLVTVRRKMSAPAIRISTAAASGLPRLTWDAVEGAVKYEIWRAASKGGTYTRMWTTASTSYTNTTAKAGSTYWYKVRAVDADGKTGAFSSVKYITCDLARPTNVTIAINPTTGQPKLTWNAVEDADGYEIWRATEKDGTYYKMWTTTKTSYNNTSAKTGVTYYYKVKSVMDESSYATSAYSAVRYITCDCAAPTATLTTKADSGKPYLTWKAVDGAAKYEVWRATEKDGTYTKMRTTSGTYYTNTAAEPGVTYYYKVRALGKTSYADGAFSTAKYITCDLARPVVTASLSSSGLPRLTWDAVEGAEKYEIWRATSEGGSYTRMWTTASTAYTNTTAKAGVTYYYKVRAIIPDSPYAASAYSAVLCVTAE